MEKRNIYGRLINNNNNNIFNFNKNQFSPGINNRFTPKPKAVNKITNINKKPILNNSSLPYSLPPINSTNSINSDISRIQKKKRVASNSMDNKIVNNIPMNKIKKMLNNNNLKNNPTNLSQKQLKKESNENNLIINSLSDYRLPIQFKDITYDTLREK